MEYRKFTFKMEDGKDKVILEACDIFTKDEVEERFYEFLRGCGYSWREESDEEE